MSSFSELIFLQPNHMIVLMRTNTAKTSINAPALINTLPPALSLYTLTHFFGQRKFVIHYVLTTASPTGLYA